MKLKDVVRPVQWMKKARAKRKMRRLELAQEKAAALNEIDLAEEEAKEMIEAGALFEDGLFFGEKNSRLKRMAATVLHERTFLDDFKTELGTVRSESSLLSEKAAEDVDLSVAGETVHAPMKAAEWDFNTSDAMTLKLIGSSDAAKGKAFVKQMHDSSGSIGIEGKDEDMDRSYKTKRRSLKITKSELAALPELEKVVKAERIKDWASRFRRADPRFQIAAFFDEVAQLGIKDFASTTGGHECDKISPILKMFYRSSVFTVWRPTSMESIRKMMKGLGVGKGLDIKGKSAKSGTLSGYVPFLQLYEEHHKKMIRTLPKEATMRIFYKTRELRDQAASKLTEVGEQMLEGWTNAQYVIASETADEEATETAMAKFMWEMENPEIILLDEYADEARPTFGVEIPERLFWEAYVMRQNTHREPGTPDDTGRPSEPAFQDMNFAALRHPPQEGRPRPVVYQYSHENEMCPLNLLVAYEENNKVSPVVSDFDCFLVGTRGVSYEDPIPESQISLLKWCIKNIEEILDGEPQSTSWTTRWLTVLKEKPVKPNMPQYGFGDPKSYLMIEQAVSRLRKDGCVRHGAECFNYYFPQELDDHFLVINDGRNDQKSPWKYVDVAGLQEILLRKIVEGYTFPLNPKWILCDPGWKQVYDAMNASEATHVQNSLNCWYPPDSGIREMIEAVYAKNPNGFTRNTAGEEVEGARQNTLSELDETEENEGTAAMDLAEQALEKHYVLQRAKKKLRAVFVWIRFAMECQAEASEREALKEMEGEIEQQVNFATPTPLSFRKGIHRSIVLNSKHACNRPVQHIRVRTRIARPTLLTDLKREQTFAGFELLSPELNRFGSLQFPSPRLDPSLNSSSAFSQARAKLASTLLQDWPSLVDLQQSLSDAEQSSSDLQQVQGQSTESTERVDVALP